jgi:hypothetical protein
MTLLLPRRSKNMKKRYLLPEMLRGMSAVPERLRGGVPQYEKDSEGRGPAVPETFRGVGVRSTLEVERRGGSRNQNG